MRIYYNILLALATVGLVSSCISDKGNYDYVDADSVMPVTITNMPKDTTILQGATLKMNAGEQFTVNNDDPSRYTYSWSVTEYTTAGFLPTRRYISEEENLNYPVKLDVGEWTLTLQIWDKKLDMYVKSQMKLNVTSSPLDAGWYVLKDQDGYTDIDYITKAGKIYADVLAPTDMRVKGEAVKIVYQNQRYYHVQKNADGTSTTLSNQKVFHILTTQDICTYNAKDLRLFKNFEEEFYVAPKVCKPQDCSYGSTNLFLLNNGQAYSIYGMSLNIGKFGAAKVGDFDFYPCMLGSGGKELVFDNNSSSFYSMDSYSSAPVPFTDAAPNSDLPASLSNMPYTMEAMYKGQDEKYTDNYGFALMKGKADGKHYLAHLRYDYSGSYSSYPIASFVEVPSGSGLLKAEHMAVPASGDFLYYSIGNKIYTYTNASGIEDRDKLQLTLPEGETVSYMFNFRSTYQTTYNYLAVLSATSTGWTLRVYEPVGIDVTEVKPEPLATYSGTGNGRFVMYREN